MIVVNKTHTPFQHPSSDENSNDNSNGYTNDRNDDGHHQRGVTSSACVRRVTGTDIWRGTPSIDTGTKMKENHYSCSELLSSTA